jgi:hypothetical protein
MSIAPLQASGGVWPNEGAAARMRNTAEGTDSRTSQPPQPASDSEASEPDADVVISGYSTFTISA